MVTGHTGFKGSWLSFWLAAAGADVTGFALPPSTNPHLFGLLDIPGKVRSLLGDVRDAAAVKRAVQTADPEVIFHLAAQAEVRAGYADPLGTFDVNVMGTANVLEAARERRELRAVVVVTSDKCYGNDDRETAYREDDCLGGDDPYSASKACAELVAGAYRRSFFGGGGCGVATARAGNVIGGGDWSRDRLVPDLVRSLVGGTPLSLRNPGAVRPWQHVLDPLAGYLTLAQQLCDGASVA